MPCVADLFLDQEHKDILNWLGNINYGAQQSDLFNKRQPGTGQWVLKSRQFQDWLAHSKSNLFCPGPPGAGKTIITSIVVDHLITVFQEDSTIGIAYIYCDYRRQYEQRPSDLLHSLLKQLSQRSVSQCVRDLYTSHKRHDTRPSDGEVSRTLNTVVSSFSKTFIAIDALDECPTSDGTRQKFLSELFRIQSAVGLSIFATSRVNDETTKFFQGAKVLQIRATSEDIEIYLDRQMTRMECEDLSPPIKDLIKKEVLRSADGM